MSLFRIHTVDRLITSCITCNQTRRFIGTSLQHNGLHRRLTFSSRLTADRFIRDLTDVEVSRLSKALKDYHEEQELQTNRIEDVPSRKVLIRTAVTSSIPFIGFGFLDNAIMIAAGEYIDLKVGVVFGISTMAAAGIGNMISDVAGIGLAGYVEELTSRLGFEEPSLTPAQLSMKQTKIACHIGRAVGIVIGCILGMFPLFFVSHAEEHSKSHEKTDNKSSVDR